MKKVKIDLLNSQYDSSYMLDGESIDDMLTRFTTITNGLISLGKLIAISSLISVITLNVQRGFFFLIA